VCQSWDCAIHLRNLGIVRNLRVTSVICERNGNGLTGWERPSWLTEESWELSEIVIPWTGTPQVWDLSAAVPRPRGREFLRVGKIPRSFWCGGLSIHAWHWRWQRSCKSLLQTSLTFIYDGNSKGSRVHRCRAISRLHTGAAQSRDCANPGRNLEIGMQFRDSEIAQIPRLRITYIPITHIYRHTQAHTHIHSHAHTRLLPHTHYNVIASTNACKHNIHPYPPIHHPRTHAHTPPHPPIHPQTRTHTIYQHPNTHHLAVLARAQPTDDDPAPYK